MTQRFALTADQAEVFERRGVVRLPRFYPEADIAIMADRLWSDIEARYGVQRDRPETWTTARPAEFQALKRSGAFVALGSGKLFELADSLLGQWVKPKYWGFVLLTFPSHEPLQARPPWHTDLTGAEQLNALPTLRVFTFLEPVEPGGGGTLYLAGSHKLAIDLERELGGPLKSAQVRNRLKAEHPWLAELTSMAAAQLRGMMGREAKLGAHSVRLEEMTGEPGDLIVMHPAILHAAAHNALDRPRLMLTEWIARAG